MQQAMKLALTPARAGVKTGQEVGLSDRRMLMAFAMLRATMEIMGQEHSSDRALDALDQAQGTIMRIGEDAAGCVVLQPASRDS